MRRRRKLLVSSPFRQSIHRIAVVDLEVHPIELAAVAAKNGKSKDATKKAAKQTALSFAPKPANTATRPVPVSEPSLTSTIGDDAPPVAAAIDNDGDIDMDTDMNGAIATGAEADNEDEDEDLEETQTDVGAGGEGRKRIVASPEWMGEEEQREGGGKVKGSVDDDEPLEVSVMTAWNKV